MYCKKWITARCIAGMKEEKIRKNIYIVYDLKKMKENPPKKMKENQKKDEGS